MNIDNIKSQMRKGMLEFCILLIIRKQPVYASELIAMLKEAHLIVVEGTLYPLLTRLKNDGLLSYVWQESTAGPPRKYYSLTDDGQRALDMLADCWNDMAGAVDHLRQTHLPNPND